MQDQRLTLWLLVLLATLTGACQEPDIGVPQRPDLQGARLLTLDSVVLAESESVFVSRPLDVLVLGDGSLLVSDLALRQVVHYSPSGELLRTIGRSGGGPGEFRSPSWMASVADTMLLVRDIPEFRIEAFDLRTGEALPGWGLDIQVFTGIAHLEDQVVVGALSTERGSSLLLFSLGDSTAAPNFVGGLPEDVHQNPMVADAFRHTAVTGRDSTITQAFEVSNYLHWVNLAGDTRDSMELPVARRKGAPVQLLPQLETKPELGMRAVSHVSQPLKIGWLNDSLLAVVMVDPDRSTSQYRGTTWVSVVDLQNRRSCVDAHVDISTDPPPSVALRADTLYFLYFAESASGRTETRMRRAVLDLGTCTWVDDAHPASGRARQRAGSTP